MAVTGLRVGSKGDQVRRLQEALNRKLPGCALRVDGDFGGNTHAAVRRYQDHAWLVVDGIAGQCTQNALFDLEAYAPVQLMRPFIPQPNDSTCWAAGSGRRTSWNRRRTSKNFAFWATRLLLAANCPPTRDSSSFARVSAAR